nr:AT rich interactive domain containing protein [Hymenolepis microstoma]
MSLPSATESAMASRVGSETPTSSILSTSEVGPGHESKSAPVFLPVGAAVSAKYRGAFCEAEIESITQDYRIRVQLKQKKGFATVDKSNVVSGTIEPNSEVSVLIKSGEFASGHPQLATILKVTDLSVYSVVFDDGDRRSLKRTQLVMKGERHFKESETLDRLPLTNPEQFKQPVIDPNRRYQSSQEDEDEREESERRRKHLKDVAQEENSQDEEEGTTVAGTNSQIDEEPTTSSGRKGKRTPVGSRRKSSTSTVPADTKTPIDEGDNWRGVDSNLHSYLGEVVMIDMPISSKNDSSLLSTSTGDTSMASTGGTRRRYTPGLVVLPSSQPSIDLKAGSGSSSVLLVKSFRENRFYAVPKNCLTLLNRSKAVELAKRNPSLRVPFEKALLWIDRRELPHIWNTDIETLLGPNWNSDSTSDEDSREHPKSRGNQKKKKMTHSVRKRRQRSESSSFVSDRTSTDGSSSDSEESEPDSAASKAEENAPRVLTKRKVQARSKSAKRPRRQRKDFSPSSLSSASQATESGDGNSVEEDDNTSGDVEDESSDSSDTGSKKFFEQRDIWIANLYNIMDQRRTPINKAPSIANKDLDLYKLFRKVHRLGGFHRVSTQMKWPAVYSEMDLPPCFSAGPKSLQTAYKKYLLPIEEMERKLGTNLHEVRFTHRKSKAVSNTSPAEKKPSIPKVNTSGEGKPPTAKEEDVQSKTIQRRMSGAKDEKVAKVAESKTKTSTNTSPAASKPGASTTGKKVEKKEKKSLLLEPTSKNRSLRPFAELVNKAPSDIVTLSSSSRLPNEGGRRSSTGGVFEESPSARSSPSRPTFDDEVYRSLHTLQGSKSWLAVGGCGTTKTPYPVGSVVSVLFKGRPYSAKILSYDYGQSFHRKSKQSTPNPQESSELTSSKHKTGQEKCRYLVHYIGWNSRHNEIIDGSRILCLLDGVRRSPSCSNLNLSGQGTTSNNEKSVSDVAESEPGGEKHSKNKKSSLNLQKFRSKNPLSSSSSLQPPKEPQKNRMSGPTKHSDNESTNNKKPFSSITPDAPTKSSTPVRRPIISSLADQQSTKKRKIQAEHALSSSNVEHAHSSLRSPGKSSGSIIDAATSLTQSPKTLKKILKRDPVGVKPPQPTATLVATSTPVKTSTLSHWEAVSSSEDEEPVGNKEKYPPSSTLVSSSSSHMAKKTRVGSSSPKTVKSGTPTSLSSAVKASSKESSVTTSGKVSSLPKLPTPTSRRIQSTLKKLTPKPEGSTSEEETPESKKRPVQTQRQVPKSTLKKEETAPAKKDKEESIVTKKSLKKLLPKKDDSKKSQDSSTSASSVSTDEDNEGTVSEESLSEDSGSELPSATRDILPRLTRSQHKLILGDNPPGAKLLTATANPSSQPSTSAPSTPPDPGNEAGVKPEEEKVKPDEEKPEKPQVDKKKDTPPSRKKRIVEEPEKPKSPVKTEEEPIRMASPALSIDSDKTEPMQDVRSSNSDNVPNDPPSPKLTPTSSPEREEQDQEISMPSESSEQSSEDEAATAGDHNKETSKSPPLIQRRITAGGVQRGRSARGGGRGGGAMKRRKFLAGGTSAGLAAPNVAAVNDDAESVVSSASSGFKVGRKVGRGGRRGGGIGSNQTPRGMSPLGSPTEGRSIRQSVSSIDTPPPQPEIRRFGGPYFPIPDSDSMDLSTYCNALMSRMVQVAKAYKSANDMLRAIDQRIASVTATNNNNVATGDSVFSNTGSRAASPAVGGPNTNIPGVGRGSAIGARRGVGGFRGGLRRRNLSDD